MDKFKKISQRGINRRATVSLDVLAA
ncbi:hypothetical protein AGR8A_Cc30378 [Agrobacterium fabrum str. J-07]|nr:hypothetical protein AGR8A_Cc30378 [Agrobacterium fabrum str. J-07]